jgi:alpha-amylase
VKKKELLTGEAFEWMIENPDTIELTFSSDDIKVATVSEGGILTGVGAGTTVIHAVNDELGIDQTIEITVDSTEIKVIGFKNVSVAYNKTAYISLEISPSNAKLSNIAYQSMNESIALVDRNGKVTGVRAGQATIELTYGNSRKVSIPVTVKPVVNSKYKSITVSVKKTFSIKNAAAVSKNGYKDLTFRSTNTKVAKVTSAGTVTGVRKGSCSIRIYDKATSKLVATVQVAVK